MPKAHKVYLQKRNKLLSTAIEQSEGKSNVIQDIKVSSNSIQLPIENVTQVSAPLLMQTVTA